MITLRVITQAHSHKWETKRNLTKHISKLVRRTEMNSNSKRKRLSKTVGVYFSVITIVLSLILALLSFDTPALLIGYSISTLTIAGITYLLRTYLSRSRKSESYNDTIGKTPPGWRPYALLLLMLIAIFVFPLFLAGFIDPYIWFTFIISLASGVSISQLIVHLQGEEID